jgi:hypothetical protein
MHDSSYFRERAAQCFRLAKSVTSPDLVDSLNQLGRDFAADAARREDSEAEREDRPLRTISPKG